MRRGTTPATRSTPGPDLTIAELLERYPAALPVLARRGMACAGCAFAPFETVAEAAQAYGVALAEILVEIRDAASRRAGAAPRARRRRTTDMATQVPDAGQRLDVREIAPKHKHPTIMARFAALAVGESFTLVNDHDPRPLYYQLAAEHAGRFEWEYLERGPEVWRVRIGKPAAAAAGGA